MPINKETIISVFDDKLTLMQWLKTIEKALNEAVLTGVEINKKGNATLSFKFTFEDGTFLETSDIVLQQGESIENAFIQNGHLYLTLTNGTNLDAGNVKPVSSFSIDANQHLIVNYADGTSQDLGAIFNGNVNINGNFTANSIIENMLGYSYYAGDNSNGVTISYAGVVKNGNKVTFTIAGSVKNISDYSACIGVFYFPSAIGNAIYPIDGDYFAFGLTSVRSGAFGESKSCSYGYSKSGSSGIRAYLFGLNGAVDGDTPYYFRQEITILLSNNLAQ